MGEGKTYKYQIGKLDEVGKGSGKYLQMQEALLNSGRLKEKQRIKLETQNGILDPLDDYILPVIIEEMVWTI